ncbi:MAG: hypothetical protein JSR77_08725 [Planctomycetes bacterium]|nr:hypothetical protein [Planctomycetota bacterium]
MTPLQLANSLESIHRDMDAINPRVREQLDIGPFRLSINSESREQFPSANRNRAEALRGIPPTPEDLDHVIAAFAARGVHRFFAWLGPGSDTPQAIATLSRRSFKEWPYVEYLALSRPAINPPKLPPTITVQRLTRGQTVATHAQLTAIFANESSASFFLDSIESKGHEHFVALDGADPIAAGMLFVHNTIGYLGGAGTRENARRRGGQAALIAARIQRCLDLNCNWCASETNTAVEGSLRNLLRAGFTRTYARRAFVFE